MGKEHPAGGACADPDCPMQALPTPHTSSTWYGLAPNKICRTCWGRKQRKTSSAGSGKRVSSLAFREEEEEEETTQLKTLHRIIGSR